MDAQAKNLNLNSLIGQIVDDYYEIDSIIGQGGMSVVYLARHILLDKYYALKMLLPQFVLNETAFQRFQNEGIIISSLNNPYIVGIHGLGIYQDSIPYIVMDYLKGVTLNNYLENSKHSQKELLQIFLQIAQALEYAHSKNIIHRDLKPSNIIIIDSQDNVKKPVIVDFGIAKILDENSLKNKLTVTGSIFGTPYYMSSEQAQGLKVDGRTDIYSLGAIMYESLTGQLPHKGNDHLQIINSLINEKPLGFKKANSSLKYNIGLEKIVFKCLETDPNKRYQKVADLISDLKKIIESNHSIFDNIKSWLYLKLNLTVNIKNKIKIFFISILMLIIGGLGIIYIEDKNYFNSLKLDTNELVLKNIKLSYLSNINQALFINECKTIKLDNDLYFTILNQSKLLDQAIVANDIKKVFTLSKLILNELLLFYSKNNLTVSEIHSKKGLFNLFTLRQFLNIHYCLNKLNMDYKSMNSTPIYNFRQLGDLYPYLEKLLGKDIASQSFDNILTFFIDTSAHENNSDLLYADIYSIDYYYLGQYYLQHNNLDDAYGCFRINFNSAEFFNKANFFGKYFITQSISQLEIIDYLRYKKSLKSDPQFKNELSRDNFYELQKVGYSAISCWGNIIDNNDSVDNFHQDILSIIHNYMLTGIILTDVWNSNGNLAASIDLCQKMIENLESKANNKQFVSKFSLSDSEIDKIKFDTFRLRNNLTMLYFENIFFAKNLGDKIKSFQAMINSSIEANKNFSFNKSF